MATTTNFGWETPDDTDLVKDGAAAIRTALGGVDTSFVDLKGGTTGQVLAKASATDLDFSWVAVDPLTILDAKGDLISATAADTPARLAVGTNGQVLTADSTASTGLKWNTPSSGGYTLISEQTASASTAIDFSSIPSTYKHLILTYDGIYASATSSQFDLRFNSSSSANYIQQYQLQETGSAPTLGNAENTYVGYASFGIHHTSTTAANTLRGSIIIYDYASTTKYKYYQAQSSYWSNNNSRLNFISVQGYFQDTTAISSLNVVRTSGTASITNLSNTSIRLYGVS